MQSIRRIFCPTQRNARYAWLPAIGCLPRQDMLSRINNSERSNPVLLLLLSLDLSKLILLGSLSEQNGGYAVSPNASRTVRALVQWHIDTEDRLAAGCSVQQSNMKSKESTKPIGSNRSPFREFSV